MAKQEQIQLDQVQRGSFQPRTKESHDRRVLLEILQDASLVQQYGVKESCPLSESLEHFQFIDGYPPRPFTSGNP